MPELKAGDSFPEGVTFQHIPYTPEIAGFESCGVPGPYHASKEFANKKVVVVSVPGAFTPTCSAAHLPGYIANADKLKAAGVDQVVFIAFNDPFVMSAWGKANNIKDDFFVFATDPAAAFSKSIGWTAGERTGRYAIVVDHGKVTYAGVETVSGSLDNSGAEVVIAKL
ncbi:peroxiredoxin type-2 [Plectosphaerella plurivora]|uniref:Thioredoxin peroxidase n=1 Tax=Plectosphaerella plurivora TaxID=936078 RepID=A0A9P8VM36_9PEZI|nr:peroxiredoxin type-2 [Plectosphaerella plurivora]